MCCIRLLFLLKVIVIDNLLCRRQCKPHLRHPRKGGDLLETSLEILPNSSDPGEAVQSPQMLPALGAPLAQDYLIKRVFKKTN